MQIFLYSFSSTFFFVILGLVIAIAFYIPMFRVNVKEEYIPTYSLQCILCAIDYFVKPPKSTYIPKLPIKFELQFNE